MKAIAEFLLISFLFIMILLAGLYTMGKNNWEEENCSFNEDNEYVCNESKK